ncbi:hypothetical protein FHS95_000313 [Sphingomonas naasensis]|uniref:Uncharacterized protein n=1 Tax=Sphingomonas naasensis TaxID=1344951 RepID=A0A4S1WR88_9SPHN|nr:hypothetical protein [Sphingomonas naasensis]NIJ18644.1 hypothetical protein [Sphingomonas naasensis]TGX45888.1 hypothetical protein E5A74_01545 [Sphingomonas naasensis]
MIAAHGIRLWGMDMLWRTKSLPLAEWAALQGHFGNLMVASGGPESLAMFMKSEPGQAESEIYITGPGTSAIEALSPGGWEDSAAPAGENVALLVGSGDPWRFFGIEKPDL